MYLLEEETPPPTQEMESQVQTVSTLVDGVQLSTVEVQIEAEIRSELDQMGAGAHYQVDQTNEIQMEAQVQPKPAMITVHDPVLKDNFTVETEVISDPEWDERQMQTSPPPPPPGSPNLTLDPHLEAPPTISRPRTSIYHRLMIAESLVGARQQEFNGAAQRLKQARDELKEAKSQIRKAIQKEDYPHRKGSSPGAKPRRSSERQKASESKKRGRKPRASPPRRHTRGSRSTKAGAPRGRPRGKRSGSPPRRRTPSKPSCSPEKEALKAKIKAKEQQIKHVEKELQEEKERERKEKKRKREKMNGINE